MSKLSGEWWVRTWYDGSGCIADIQREYEALSNDPGKGKPRLVRIIEIDENDPVEVVPKAKAKLEMLERLARAVAVDRTGDGYTQAQVDELCAALDACIEAGYLPGGE